MSTVRELEFKFMEEIKSINNKLTDLALKLEGLPEKIMEKGDNRYASKETENRFNALQAKIEERNYDWVKYAIVTFVGIMIAVFVSDKLGV